VLQVLQIVVPCVAELLAGWGSCGPLLTFAVSRTTVLSGAITVTLAVTSTLAPLGTSPSWQTMVPSPNPPSTQGNDLNGVSCSSATFCMAVGSHYNSAFQTLIEKW
jgi:hypothetical protein